VSPKFLRDVRFFAFLHLLDLDLAELVREGGCSLCGGPLHAASYPRKLRGLPEEARPLFAKRKSFCCGRDLCRRRATPPSVVFFGRRLFPAAMVLLVSALAHGASERRLARLNHVFEVDRRTLLRWRVFWRDTFPESSFFRAEAGRFSPPLRRHRLLPDLLRRFAGELRERVRSALLFLSPLSTGSVPVEHARRWAGETRRGRVVPSS
jgi:hypothetical protein